MAGKGAIRLEGRVELKGEYPVRGEALENLLLWKPRIGEALTVSDEARFLYRARLIGLTGDGARLLVFEEMGPQGRPPLDMTLLQALPDKERMEIIIQKTTELGVQRIVPIRTDKSISIEERDLNQRKSRRWADVALKASKQSRRDTIPEVLPCRTFVEALSAASKSGLKIMLSEKNGLPGLKGSLAGRTGDGAIRELSLLVGPEGGFTEEEDAKAQKAGFARVSLGRRILRTETAAIVGVGILDYELGG